MSLPPRCSIVIPTWNARLLIERCLNSIKNNIDQDRVEVIVVDDCSTDDTIEKIRKSFQFVVLVAHDKNLGFGGACNSGVLSASNKLVVLLNNDVIVTEPFLDPLLAHFDSPEVFAVNPRVYQKVNKMPGGGLVRGEMHCGLLRLRWAEDESARGESSLTLYGNGAAMAVSRPKFLELGGFDNLYAPFYSEDLDLSYRAYQKGWVVKYEPSSQLTHDHGATIGKGFNTNYVDRISMRNRLLFVWRNIRDKRFWAQHIFWMIVRTLGAFASGNTNFIRALFGAILLRKMVIKKRQTDPKIVVPDRKILGITSNWAEKEYPESQS